MYADIAASYDALHGAEQHRKLRALLARIDLDEIDSVLDVGCATAHCAAFFSCKYLGIDPCQELLDLAPDGVEVTCASGEKLPVGDASFDLVMSLTALHNYDDPLAGVDELARASRNVVIVGVLRKSEMHDAIVSRLKEVLQVQWSGVDQHDTLLVLTPREE